MKSRKYEMPILSRSTEWSEERIAKLSLPELKALLANAERLQEDGVAALCERAMKTARAEARKLPPPRKPGAKPVAKLVAKPAGS